MKPYLDFEYAVEQAECVEIVGLKRENVVSALAKRLQGNRAMLAITTVG